jgi:hypothetical protein
MGEEHSLEDGGDRQWQCAVGLTIHPETALVCGTIANHAPFVGDENELAKRWLIAQ